MMTPPVRGMCSWPCQSRFIAPLMIGGRTTWVPRRQTGEYSRFARSLMCAVSPSSSGQSPGCHAPVSRQDHGMPAPPARAPLRWSLVVPVKVLARAKTRLAALAGQDRPALALAMAADTVAAALGSPEVGRVIVVTDDPQAARVLAGLGAVIVPEPPGRGLNRALRHGAAHSARGGAVAAGVRAGLRRVGDHLVCRAPGDRVRAEVRAWVGRPAPGGRGGRAHPARPGRAATRRRQPGRSARRAGTGAGDPHRRARRAAGRPRAVITAGAARAEGAA